MRIRTGGLIVVVVYAVVAAVTVRLSDHHVRPLFEGIGPAPPYQWVDPPKEFAAANEKPHAATREIVLHPEEGSALTSVSSGDAQVVTNLPVGAVPPNPDASAVAVEFTPLAAKGLALPPARLVADGNAYRITVAYKPSGAAVTQLAKPGNIVMALPHPGQTILWSPDGKQRWTRLETVQAGGPTILGTRFDKAGYYLGAGMPIAASDDSNTGTIILVGAVVVGLALALALGPVLLRRLRQPKTRSEQRRQQRRRR